MANQAERLQRMLKIRLPAGAPPKPDNLSADADEAWDQLAELLAKHGCLTPADQASFALLCEAIGRCRTALDQLMAAGSTESTERGSAVTAECKVALAWFDRAMKACQAFGLTPMARGGSAQVEQKATGTVGFDFFGTGNVTAPTQSTS